MATVLFTNLNELKKTTPLSGNIDGDKIIEFIKMAQEIHVQQLIGTDLYVKLMNDIQTSSLTGDYETLVNDYIKPVVNHQTFAMYLPFASLIVSSKGVFKHTSENSNDVDSDEVNALTDKYNGYVNYYKQRLSDYLCANSELFPEYFTNTEEDIDPRKHNSNLDWWLY